MAGAMKIFCIRKKLFSHNKKNLLFLPCNMAAVQNLYDFLTCIQTGLVRVLGNLESPGILLWHFPGLESPGKRTLVLESSGNLLNSAKKHEVCGRQEGELTLRCWDCRG